MRRLNSRQLRYRKIFLEKLACNIYKLHKNRCPCRSSKDILICGKDGFDIPLRVVLCKRCGTMRVDPYYSEETLRGFYNFEYRNLYEPISRVNKKFFDREIEGGRFIYKYLFSNYFKKDITNKIIFDIGCSAGGTLYYFKQMKNDVVGCDYDSTYVRYGERKGLNLKVGGIEKLEQLSKKADIIILCHALEHFPNPVSALRKIKRLLKYNGIIFIAVPGIYFIHKSSNADFSSYIQNAHSYYFTLKTLAKIANISGLDLVYGDESVFAVFRKGKSYFKGEGENYKDILRYLEKISKYKYWLLFKGKLETYALKFLRSVGLLNMFIDIYHSMKKGKVSSNITH